MNATPTPRIDLSRWEAEGGTPLPSAMQPGADAPLLQRLGAALVAEWNKLPMPLQRAIYDRAVAAGLADDDDDEPALKRRMALFLHQHKRPATTD
jgi:hypothetical protein